MKGLIRKTADPLEGGVRPWRARRFVPELLILGGLAAGAVSVFLFLSSPEATSANETTRKRTVDCGAASLYAICKSSGNERPLQYLRVATSTSPTGTSMFHLKEASESLGFEANGSKVPFSALYEHVSDPGGYAILHLDYGHFVPVFKPMGPDRVRIVDSDLGVLDLTARDLENHLEWAGVALLIRTPSQLAKETP